MNKFTRLFLVLGVGVALGRMFDGLPPEADAGGGNRLPPCQDINGDGQINISDAIFFLNWQFLGGPQPTCPPQNNQPAGLPDTGQSACYDLVNQNWEEVPCADATCKGQDASYASGCPLEGRFVDNGDGTVTDTCTQLIWQKDTADVNVDGKSTDQDFVLWCDALAYCETLTFAGKNDWRLPNVRELQSIVDYRPINPSIDPVFGALSAGYWSSTSLADSPVLAWVVGFFGGSVLGAGKVSNFYVRAVRSAP